MVTRKAHEQQQSEVFFVKMDLICELLHVRYVQVSAANYSVLRS